MEFTFLSHVSITVKTRSNQLVAKENERYLHNNEDYVSYSKHSSLMGSNSLFFPCSFLQDLVSVICTVYSIIRQRSVLLTSLRWWALLMILLSLYTYICISLISKYILPYPNGLFV